MTITGMAARRCVQLALLGASAPVSSAVMAAPALAQNATAIEEVVVTARKVAENLQDVPVAVTVLSGEPIRAIYGDGWAGGIRQINPATGLPSNAFLPNGVIQKHGKYNDRNELTGRVKAKVLLGESAELTARPTRDHPGRQRRLHRRQSSSGSSTPLAATCATSASPWCRSGPMLSAQF